MKKSGIWGPLAAALCLIALWTAGAEETAAPAPAPSLIITEACADNDFVWTLDFQDYLELYNAGEETVHLRDYRLQVKQKTAALPDRDVAPGEYCVVVCDGGELPALSKSGCAVALLDAAGHAVDSVILPASKNQVWLRGDGLSYVPSPGFENTREGAAAWHRSVTDGLIISEALPGNFKAVQTKERGVDVLEIYNGGKNDVKLSDYYLSDDRERLTLFHLPDTVLKPGQYYVLYCTESRSDSRHTGFKLSSGGETVYLTKGKTNIADVLNSPNASQRKYALEGYLAPDTYEVYVTATAEEILRKLLSQTEAVFPAEMQERAEGMGMTMDQALTLASMIEKEAGAGDFAKVSAVFHNRLKAGMK